MDRTGRDAEELEETRRGLWPLERVQAVGESLFAEADKAHDASKLPQKPDREGAERLLVGILQEHFEGTTGDAART